MKAKQLPIADILEGLAFAARTAAMYSAGSQKRGHQHAAAQHHFRQQKFDRAHAAVLALPELADVLRRAVNCAEGPCSKCRTALTETIALLGLDQ